MNTLILIAIIFAFIIGITIGGVILFFVRRSISKRQADNGKTKTGTAQPTSIKSKSPETYK